MNILTLKVISLQGLWGENMDNCLQPVVDKRMADNSELSQ